VANSDGQVRFAHAGRADKDQVVTFVDKLEVQQCIDLALADCGLVAVIKAFQKLLCRKASRLVVASYAAALPLLQLV